MYLGVMAIKGYKTVSDGEAPIQEIWWVWSTLLFPLLPSPLWPIKVPSESNKSV